jgi:hypothetical protein
MIHKNLDRCLDLLPGTFAQQALSLSYASLLVTNTLPRPEPASPLLSLLDGWVSYYPSLAGQRKILLGEAVLQERISPDEIPGYLLYLQYLDLIAFDLWKLLTGNKSEEAFLAERSIKA